MATWTSSDGKRVSDARKNRNMTQGQLANHLGVRQAMVSMLETGEAEPSDELRARVNEWIASGRGPRQKSPRGPYRKKARITLPT